jgi:membrane protease YdiL (CAAX protease family)
MITRRQIALSLLFFILIMVGSIALAWFMGYVLGLTSAAVIAAILALTEASLLIPPWFFVARRHPGGWEKLGFKGFKPEYLGLGCGLLLLVYMFNIVWALFLALFNLEVQPDILPIFGGGLPGLLLALLVGSVIAPVAEETFFRGLLFNALKEHYGLIKAILLNAFLFALLHFQPTAFPPIFVLGCILAIPFHLSGSLWPSITIHATVNTLSLILAFLTEQSSHL